MSLKNSDGVIALNEPEGGKNKHAPSAQQILPYHAARRGDFEGAVLVETQYVVLGAKTSSRPNSR